MKILKTLVPVIAAVAYLQVVEVHQRVIVQIL